MAFDKDLKINIIGDASKLTNAMGKAGGQVDKFAEKIGKIGKTMTIVGGAVTAAFGAIIMKTTQLGDTYDKMAKRTNVSVEALSALGYAAKISGADLDTVEKSLRYLARGMDDMSMGVGEAKDAFEFLDIAVVNAEGNLRPTIEVLKEAATKLAKMTDETKQVALATDIFGARYGTQLLPMLKEGGEGIEKLMKRAKELNIVWSTESAKAAADFTDRLTELKESIGGAGRDIGTILIPPLIKFSEKAIEIIKRIKEWAEAHKPLVDMIVKVGATLGVLAAVGGPILLAVSAFMKMKVAITAIGVAIKVLAISSGPIGWLILAVGALALAWTTNFGGIRDFTIAVVDKVKEALGWLWDKVKWVLEKLGLYKEKIEEVNPATSELAKVTEEAGKKAGKAATDIGNLADSMVGLETKTDDAKTALDEFGNKIETFNEWTARLHEEWAKQEEEMTNKLKEEEDKRKTILEKFAETQKNIADRTYELTHTEMENHIRKLNEQKQVYVEAGMAIEDIEKWYSAEIAKLDELYNAEDRVIEKKNQLASAYKTISDQIFELTHTPMETAIRKLDQQKQTYINLGVEIALVNKWYDEQIIKLEKLNPEVDNLNNKLEESTEATKKLGILGGESFEGFTTQIKHATTALSNFTKEGVAAAIANIKMKFRPMIDSLQDDLGRATGIFAQIAEANLARIRKTMNDQIDVIKYGLDVYNQAMGQMSGGGGGGSMMPTYSPPVNEGGGGGSGGGGGGYFGGSKSVRNTYSPSIVVNVSGGGNTADIKRAVQEALDESNRQYFRQGKEILLGA